MASSDDDGGDEFSIFGADDGPIISFRCRRRIELFSTAEQCGGDLVDYDPDSDSFTCDQCGSTVSMSELEIDAIEEDE